MPEKWVEHWLTQERYAKYVRAAGGDHERALALYEWNAELAAALLHDLNHLEVGIRNAYDRALLRHPVVAGSDWLEPSTYERLFAAHIALDASGQPQDKNATPRSQIKAAKRVAGYTPGGPVPRGKVVAELTFGFWSYLSDNLHEKTLWVPSLHTAFVPGADRAKLHSAFTHLRAARNRVAHHESIFDQRAENVRRTVLFVARNLSPELHGYISRTSRLAGLLAARP